ncbi:hypothetical protein [Micrococcus sp.]|uniref:hypothetical protein n=1 Tax=Micrococcus sp. TaxID=1271 RepID=UPI002A912DE3|nr:hypothetical protein [Micrococcus sp.]MDY6055783.1 hypothetical protein [Micrococcus sp.]
MSTPNAESPQAALKKGRANMQRGLETAGGHLELFADRLVFTPHSFNVQSDAVEVPLREVQGTRPVWTKFLNLIPLGPNSLAVDLADGSVRSFVLPRRLEWKSAIDDAVAALR